jgi:methyltransferase family protein
MTERDPEPGRIQATLDRKPWVEGTSQAPQDIFAAKGMIGPEERRALFWLARNYYKGEGAIVDAGAYVGSSAVCLAAGLAKNTQTQGRRPIIYSYDYFKAFDAYVAEQITRDFRPTRIGDDYLDIFQKQTEKYAEFVRPMVGDFLDSRWGEGPIDILFIDIAKTQDLNSHLIREFFPHLVPDRSLVVHQDFFHCWHPHIHITMEALSDYFEVMDEHIQFQSRLYMYRRAIPKGELARVADYVYSPAERLALLDDVAKKEIGEMRAMMRVVKLWQLLLDGDTSGFEDAHAAFTSAYGDVRRRGLWWRRRGLWWYQAQEVMAHFEGRKERARARLAHKKASIND